MLRTFRSATRRPLSRRASSIRPELLMLEGRESPTDLFGLLSGLFLGSNFLFLKDPEPSMASESASDIEVANFAQLNTPEPSADSPPRANVSNRSTPTQSNTPAVATSQLARTFDVFATLDAFAASFGQPLGSKPESAPLSLGGSLTSDQQSSGMGSPSSGASGRSGGATGSNDGGGSGGGNANTTPDATPDAGPSMPDTSQTESTGATTLSAASTEAIITSDVETPSATSSPPPHLVDQFASAPMQFEQNRGQTDSQVEFVARGAGYNLFITPNSAVLTLARPNADADTERLESNSMMVDVVAMSFVGGDPQARVKGHEQLLSRSNYFHSDPSGAESAGILDIVNYRKVASENVYDGIDVEYYTNARGKLEFDVVVRPGADAAAAQMEILGAENLSLDGEGNLVVETPSGGRLVYQAPVLYQQVGAVKQEVSGSYVLLGQQRVGFAPGDYDVSRPLVIDPVLDYSSYLGGSGNDEGLAVAVDGAGNTYITGKTLSTDFPTLNPFISEQQGNSDVFVSMVNAPGNQLIYSTYVGGAADEQGNGIAVDAAGNAYVVGTTASSDFPTTTGAYQTSFGGGGTDIFLFKLSATGDSLHYGTYIGGNAADVGRSVAVDATGRAFLTGDSAGGTFPTTTGAYDTSHNGGTNDVVVAGLSVNGTTAVYSTFLGGSGADIGYGIAVMADGTAFVAGGTNSTNYPTVNAYDSTYNSGNQDAFVTKLNATGTALSYSTYFGNFYYDCAYAIAVNRNGNAFITGHTNQIPTTSGAAQTSYGGGTSDAFATGFSSDGQSLVYSTFLGGSGADEGRGIAVSLDNYVTVVGKTSSSLFPTSNALYSTLAGGTDAFVTRFKPEASAGWNYSTYLGGSGDDQANGVAVDFAGSVYVTGTTASTNFPTKGPFQSSSAGGTDAFVAKIANGLKPPVFTSISSDTGSSSSDQITTDQTLSFSGTAVNNSTVTFTRRDLGEIGSVQSDQYSGAWTFDYTSTTLAEGTYAFVATNTSNGVTSEPTKEFFVTVDRTGPTVTASVPASTSSLAPQVRVVARDLNGLPDGTAVAVDVDLNNDTDYLDANEANYASATLTAGAALLPLPALASTGVYRLRARVTDPAGNEGVSADASFTVASATAYAVETAAAVVRDPSEGMIGAQLGNVSVSHKLDLDRSPGSKQAGNPELVYDSSSVSVRPIIQATIATPNNVGSLPSTVTVTLTWNGVAETPVPLNITGIAPGDVVTVSVQVEDAVSATGRYAWSLDIEFDGQTPLQDQGSAFVRVEDASPFGAGWTLSNLNRLVDIPSNASGPAGQLWLYGGGGFRFFEDNGDDTFTSPTEDNGTLVRNQDDSYTYTTPEGVEFNFDSSGRQTSWVSGSGFETIGFDYVSELLDTLTAIDGAESTFNYTSGKLSSIGTAGSRTFTIDIVSGDLTEITDPDNRVHAFTYSGATHRVTSEARDHVQNQFAYDAFGLVESLTWGDTGSPTEIAIMPVAVRGLAAAYRNPEDFSGNDYRMPDAALTDALGNTTIFQLDGGGRPVVQVAPDGTTTVWVRDGAGRIESMTDPLGRTTTYQRDSLGYVTLETLPDNNTRSYVYQPAFHALTSVTDERGNDTDYTYDATTGQLLTVSWTVTDVDLNASQFTISFDYNATTGLLETVTDALERETTYTYLTDGSRRLSQTTDPFGTTDLTYDSTSGEIASYTDRLDRVTTMTRDAMGRLLTQTDPLTNTEEWTYDDAGLLSTYTDRTGAVVQTQYDVHGRGLVEIVQEAQGSSIERISLSRFDDAGRADGSRDTGGAWTTRTLDAVGRTVATMDAFGGVRRQVFDVGGQVEKRLDPLGNTTSYVHNDRGWVTQVTDAAGKVWGTTFDAAGNVTQTTDPLNHSWSYERDELGRARKVTDPATNVTKTVWFGDGRVKETIDAVGTKTAYAYDLVNLDITITQAVGTAVERSIVRSLDAEGNVVAVTNGLSHTWEWDFDGNNNVVSAADPLTNTVSYTRDDEGRVTALTDQLNKQTSYTRDLLGRAVAVTDPLANTRQYVLSATDRTVATIDALGKVQQQAYNALGQNVYAVSAIAGVEQNDYDAGGRATSLTDPVGNQSGFQQDGRGQVTAKTDAVGNSGTMEYDDAGRLTKAIDRLGRVREYEYFNNNLLKKETWRETELGAVVWTREFTYNGNGQMLTATDNNGGYTFTYDALGRVATVNDVWDITLTFTWDDADRLVAIDDSEGGAIDLEYDNANRNTVRKFDDGVTEVRLDLVYNGRGQVTQVKRYSDVAATTLVGKTVYTFDDAARLTRIDHQDDSATTLDDFDYQYDDANRVTQETSDIGPTRDYEYDDAGQLTADGTDDWTFDKNGNRTMSGFVTDDGNRLVSDGTWNYQYDDEGNVIRKVEGTTGETWVYAYNHLNQLVEAEHDPDGQSGVDLRVSYAYDVFGNRITRSVDADGDGAGAAVEERFAYNVGVGDPSLANAWADLDGSGSLTTRRLYLDAVDAVFARIGNAGDVAWYLTDRLGSVRDLMDNTGTVLDHIDYGSFGEVSYESAPASGDRYKFTARELDGVTGLQYNRARWYSFDMAGWTSEDPIGFAAGDANLYRYVGNDPVNATDPSGLTSLLHPGTAGIQAWAYGVLGGAGAYATAVVQVSAATAAAIAAAYGSYQLMLSNYMDYGVSGAEPDAVSAFNQGFAPDSPSLPFVNTYQQAVSANQQQAVVAEQMLDATHAQQRYQNAEACFAAGTRLLTPQGYKAIEEFRAGDQIVSRPEYDPDGPVVAKLVEEVFVRSAPLLHVHVQGQNIRAVAEHPFWVQGKGWVAAGELKAGDQLLSHDGQSVNVDEVYDTGEWETVYNLRIADFHTYFVGGDEWGFSVWTHNACVLLYKAPQNAAIAAQLLTIGFTPATFSMPGGDNSAYLAKDKSIADEFAASYGAGVLEIRVPEDVYNQHLRQYEHLYQGGPRVELAVPHVAFSVLNQCLRRMLP
jgi:RHS repeat-associated protein